MYAKDDGWVCLGYPDSTYLIFDSDGEHLLTMADNDCLPGSPIFTNDMNLLFSQRGISIEASPTPDIDEVIAFLEGVDWKEYIKNNKNTAESIASISEADESFLYNDNLYYTA